MNKPGFKFYDSKIQVLRWIQFYFDYNIDKSSSILDFGTGPGWAIYVGRYLDYNVVGLDIKTSIFPNGKYFEDIRKILDVEKYTTLYDLNKVPFNDGEFDIIFCKAVLDKYVEKLRKQNELELNRILNKNGMIYVSPSNNLNYIPSIKNKCELNKIKKIDDSYRNIYYEILNDVSKRNLKY